jgi:hypothetical protein
MQEENLTMKIIFTATIKPKAGEMNNVLEKCKTAAALANDKAPDSHFSFLTPRDGHWNRIIWVENHPSLAAFEQWEENLPPGFAQLQREMFALIVDGDMVGELFKLHE